ncbi:hypothetical protein O0L34_g10294 [Tuta absoluta]|nr:hypothetical protein O0L34_g10294 [Tuta absoluta]
MKITTSTTVNPFAPATQFFYSEEKANDDDDEEAEIGEEKKKGKEELEHLNEEYLFKENKTSYELEESQSDYVQMIGNITNYTPFITSTYSEKKENNIQNIVPKEKVETSGDSNSLEDTSLGIKKTSQQNKILFKSKSTSSIQNQYNFKEHNSDKELKINNNQEIQYTKKYENEDSEYTSSLEDKRDHNNNTYNKDRTFKGTMNNNEKIYENAGSKKKKSVVIKFMTKKKTTSSRTTFVNPDALEFSNQDGIPLAKIKDKYTETRQNIFIENALLQNKKKRIVSNVNNIEKYDLRSSENQHEEITLQDKDIEKNGSISASVLRDESISYSDYYGDTSSESDAGVPIEIIDNEKRNGYGNAEPSNVMKLRETTNSDNNSNQENNNLRPTTILSSAGDAPKLKFIITFENDTNDNYRRNVISTEITKTINTTPTQNTPQRRMFQQLEKSEENGNKSESIDEEDLIIKEQFQTKILRKAYGDACLKVVIRKCWKACKAALKDTCKKYNCKGDFKEDLKKNAKRTCINEFTNSSLRRGENSDSTHLLDMTGGGYLAAACLMSRRINPPLRSNASIEAFGPFIQLNILRNKYEKECRKTSTKKCKNACTEAMTRACEGKDCESRKKKYFKKQCKRDCKDIFGGKKIRSKSKKHKKHDKHKKHKKHNKHHDSDSSTGSSCDSDESSDSSKSSDSDSSSSSGSSEGDRKKLLTHKKDKDDTPSEAETHTQKNNGSNIEINNHNKKEESEISTSKDDGSKISTTKAEIGESSTTKAESGENATKKAEISESGQNDDEKEKDLTRNKKHRLKKTKQKKNPQRNKKTSRKQAQRSKNASP